MDNVIRPSFRNSEKRKAKAHRQMSFGFGSHSPDCGSPSLTFSPLESSKLRHSVVEQHLRSSHSHGSSGQKYDHNHMQRGRTEATPLFVSQQNTSFIASTYHEAYPRNVGLFGYSCEDDSSLASPLRCINNMISLPVCDDKTSEKLQNVKKQLNYSDSVQEPSIASSSDECVGTTDATMLARTVYVNKQGVCHSDLDVDVTNEQTGTSSSEALWEDRSNCSISSTDDGTLHDSWLIEDMVDDMTVESSQSHKSGIEPKLKCSLVKVDSEQGK